MDMELEGSGSNSSNLSHNNHNHLSISISKQHKLIYMCNLRTQGLDDKRGCEQMIPKKTSFPLYAIVQVGWYCVALLLYNLFKLFFGCIIYVIDGLDCLCVLS